MRSRAVVALWVLAADLSVAGEVVEKVLADVDGQAVLLSEARLVARLRRIGEEAAVEALIDERLMFREAVRLPQASVSVEEEARGLEAIRRAADEGVDVDVDPEWGRIVRRQATILKYIDFRFRPQIRVDDADVNAACAAAPCERALVRTRLETQALQARIDAWVRELRFTATIRYPVGGPGPDPGELVSGAAAP